MSPAYRQFSPEERARYVAEYDSLPPGSRLEWAKKNNLASSLISRWRRREKRAEPARPPAQKGLRYHYTDEQWKKIVAEARGDAKVPFLPHVKEVVAKYKLGNEQIVGYHDRKFRGMVYDSHKRTAAKNNPRRKPISDELIAVMLEDWKTSGMAPSAIAAKHGVHHDTLLRAIKKAGHNAWDNRYHTPDLVESTNKALVKVNGHTEATPSLILNRKTISGLTKRYLLMLEEAGVELQSLARVNGEYTVRYEMVETFTL